MLAFDGQTPAPHRKFSPGVIPARLRLRDRRRAGSGWRSSTFFPYCVLAVRMGIALSTTSRMVDLLDSTGWIQRRPDPQDQRASVVALSRTGRAVLEARRRETAARLAEQIALLTAEEQRALYAALPALEALSERAATYPGELPRGI
ncbi:MarR family winged helix-turn-helix transcriptional regulator [Streptomyces scopuliridis]|uniref:MarR family winged helix-turn-helix transcriptional regulator n=1 Tax=Streptomyces scopuliridis TaxID=452529 RepID=UPI003684A6B1